MAEMPVASLLKTGWSFSSDFGPFQGSKLGSSQWLSKGNLDFYRATRMHSAESVARCSSVCLSVCHTPVFSLNVYTYLQSFFTIG